MFHTCSKQQSLRVSRYLSISQGLPKRMFSRSVLFNVNGVCGTNATEPVTSTVPRSRTCGIIMRHRNVRMSVSSGRGSLLATHEDAGGVCRPPPF